MAHRVEGKVDEIIEVLMQVLLAFSLIVLVAIPFWFICHKVYKDGVVGRLSLCGIVFNAGIILMMMFIDGWTYNLPYEVTMLIASFALYNAWNLFRFHGHVLRLEKAKRGEIERRSDAVPQKA